MSFISLNYILFFCIVVPLYFVLPLRWRWLLLLAASYLFYSFARASYVLLIAFSTLVDYFAARGIAQIPNEQIGRRRALLALSITVNLSMLFVFKYFNFFGASVTAVLSAAGMNAPPLAHSFVLPVGISFYTFQSMAYTFDVYRGKTSAERNLGIVATYVAFFPQLVAGPIERAPNMMPQFYQKHKFDYDRVVSGLRRVLWGAFKKIVIADQLAVYVNAVYSDLDTYTGLPLLMGTFFFTIQIYCDFSGYSDIAIGSARVLGFELMENFNRPYLTRSIRDFWRHWHISLSTWFLHYIYIPLGGSRVGFGRQLANLMIVFLVSGLWHGAGWTFVIYGALQGLYVVGETLYNTWEGRPRLKETSLLRWSQRTYVFVLTMFAFVIFRSNTMSDAIYAIRHLFDFSSRRAHLLRPLFGLPFDPRLIFLGFVALSGLLIVIEWGDAYFNLGARVMQSRSIRWGIYYVALAMILLALLLVPPGQPFYYFQF